MKRIFLLAAGISLAHAAFAQELVPIQIRPGVFPLITVKAGKPAENAPCEPLSAHGFFGKEEIP